MKKFVTLMIGLLLPVAAFSLSNSELVGKWKQDKGKTQGASDGNYAGAMDSLTIKGDGTFNGKYGIGGKWNLKGGKLVVRYKSGWKDFSGSMSGSYLKFPSPAGGGKKFGYFTKGAGGKATKKKGKKKKKKRKKKKKKRKKKKKKKRKKKK